MKSPVVVTCAFVLAACLSQAEQISHPFICTDYRGNKVCVVAANGTIEWSYDCVHPQDCWRLANGNYLFCYETGAREVRPDKTTTWAYNCGTNTQVHACQPLPDGRVLLVENGPCRIIEVGRDGRIAKEIKLTPPPTTVTLHEQFRGTRKTVDGHYLVSRKGEHRIEELDSDGKSIRSIPVPGDVHSVILLPNRHLLIGCGEGHKVIEIDENQKVVWSVDQNEIPGQVLRLVAGLQRLPNGDTLICNYLGHGFIGKQANVFEVTPDKNVVWESFDKAHFQTINQIQLLDVPGDVSKGEILR